MAKNQTALRRGLVVGLASTAMVLGAAAPAFADSSCAANRVCMWEDNNYGGSKYVNASVTGTIHEGEIGWWNGDNEISSIKNTSSFYICVYPHDTPTGYHIIVPPRTNVPNLAQAYGFDNDAESYRAYDDDDDCP